MCERANTRVAFGSPLADKQQIQAMIFETAAEIQSCRLLTLDAAHKLDRGDPARVEIGIIKVLGARMLHNAIDRAIQVFGRWSECIAPRASAASTTGRTRCIA
jgi:alkylation response protein AidB-like acyl-CoA dehydrogenase